MYLYVKTGDQYHREAQIILKMLPYFTVLLFDMLLFVHIKYCGM
jgi:hypothetical protein